MFTKFANKNIKSMSGWNNFSSGGNGVSNRRFVPDNASYLPTMATHGYPSESTSRRPTQGNLIIGEIYQPNLGGFVVGNDSMVEWCAFGNWCRLIAGFILCPAMIFLVLLALAALGIIGSQFF